VPRRKIFDSIIRHRIDLASFARGEAAAVVGILSAEDQKLVMLLRQRLPNLKPGDLAASRTKALLKAVRDLRKVSLTKAQRRTRDGLLELVKAEGAAVERMTKAAIGTPVAAVPATARALRGAVVRTPIAAGPAASRTIGQWFGKMQADDQRRLQGALVQGISRQETVETMVQRIAGTRKLGFRDGALAITRREAEVAARTSVVHAANTAQLEWNRANADVVSGSEWISILDDRTCSLCASYNHGFVPNGDAPPPKGMRVIDAGMPPAHPQCRCTLIPVFDLDRLAAKIPDKIEVPEGEAPPKPAPVKGAPAPARTKLGSRADSLLRQSRVVTKLQTGAIAFGKAQVNAARKLEALGLVTTHREGPNLMVVAVDAKRKP
jgi:SPP1 gp7 family putative phage head morphogenesis protein